ncbi:MAG: hypothetical protein A2Y38_00490 [Spirochaetes bacterium GWB1_59_5]|nr:MAG: hypothetical protein A2Y38_00490 [Spirochaetes bacterium GWB1_59_5]
MSSFSKMGGPFPAGYFRGVAQWLLQNRRDLPARVATISAELNRIGTITVLYDTYKDADGNTRAKETALGFSVTEGSTLAHLVRAYIANGGNPFNISKFLIPNTTTSELTASGSALTEQYPGGGVVAPQSVEYNDPLPVLDDREKLDDPTANAVTGDDKKFTAPTRSGYEGHGGGYLKSDRYYAGRMGGRMGRGSWDSNTVVRMMHDVRRWANQDIKTRVQDIEWRILKQMDLREQLLYERDSVVVQAFGSLQYGIPPFDPASLRRERLVPVILDEMAKLISTQDPATAKLVGSGAGAQSGFLTFVFPDVTSESLQTL